MQAVQTFIDNLSVDWQREVCKTLLAIQKDVNAGIEGAIKWQNPYFNYNGQALLKWYCAKDWTNVYFFNGKRLDDPGGLFEETNNKAMRTVKIFADTKLDKEAYRELVNAAVVMKS